MPEAPKRRPSKATPGGRKGRKDAIAGWKAPMGGKERPTGKLVEEEEEGVVEEEDEEEEESLRLRGSG